MRNILASAIALSFISSAAMAFERPTLNLGVERSLEDEVNTLSVGSDFAFNIDNINVDVSHGMGPVTVYMKNDFDSGLKHDDTTVGVKFKF